MLEVAEAEQETGLLEQRSGNARPFEQESLPELAEDQACDWRGHRKQCRTPEYAAQNTGELAIRDWLGRDGVHRAVQVRGEDQMLYGPYQIVEQDPAQILAPAPHDAPQTESKRQQHPCQSPALRRQHHSDTQIDHTNAALARGRSGLLPGAADLGQKALARFTLLVDPYLSAVPVVAHRRGSDQHAWGRIQAGQFLGQEACPAHAALANHTLALRAPAALRYAGPRQVNDGIDTFEDLGIELSLVGIPGDLRVRSSLVSHKTLDVVDLVLIRLTPDDGPPFVAPTYREGVVLAVGPNVVDVDISDTVLIHGSFGERSWLPGADGPQVLLPDDCILAVFGDPSADGVGHCRAMDGGYTKDAFSCVAWARDGACDHVPSEFWLNRPPVDGEWSPSPVK